LLCFWQTQRLEWKNNLIESINSNYNSVLDEFPLNDENSQYEFMNTSVKGQLLTGKKMFFYKFNLKGESGYEIVLPMQMISKKIYLCNTWLDTV
jgi:cytochrome oxidase assembly protein ShyY1